MPDDIQLPYTRLLTAPHETVKQFFLCQPGELGFLVRMCVGVREMSESLRRCFFDHLQGLHIPKNSPAPLVRRDTTSRVPQ